MNSVPKLIISIYLLLHPVYSQIITTENFPKFGAKAVAAIRGSFNGSNISGTVSFYQAKLDSYLFITVNITGLPVGKGELKHGLHIHQNGITDPSLDTTISCGSAGPHYNPTNKQHGAIEGENRHIGDFGNVISDNNGLISITFREKYSKIYGEFSILGRTIVLHEKEDDLGLGSTPDSKKTGNSGARIACGTIGILV